VPDIVLDAGNDEPLLVVGGEEGDDTHVEALVAGMTLRHPAASDRMAE
jgi:hypothetical protein